MAANTNALRFTEATTEGEKQPNFSFHGRQSYCSFVLWMSNEHENSGGLAGILTHQLYPQITHTSRLPFKEATESASQPTASSFALTAENSLSGGGVQMLLEPGSSLPSGPNPNPNPSVVNDLRGH